MMLFAAWINIHVINIQCVQCKPFVCRQAIEKPDGHFPGMGMLENIDSMLYLFHELFKVPPSIVILPRVDYLP